MTIARREAFRLVLSSGTMLPVDQQRCVIAMRAASSPEEMRFVTRLILDARRSWLNYISRSQRHWQTEMNISRNPDRPGWRDLRSHRSAQVTRERYVRCES